MSRELIERFYAAFDRKDGDAMAACYHPDARFSDPAFGELRGAEIGRMWRMLTERGEELEVEALPMRVMILEDVFVTKLLALDERSLDYVPALEMARPVREQVDWDDVRRRTAESPFAKAFFTLVEELGVVKPRPADT